jgi:adenylosuccinate synthase
VSDLLATAWITWSSTRAGTTPGHAVVIGEESYALHLMPSGVLSPEVTPVIGNGVVIDPQVLLVEIEIDGLTERGVDCGKLLVLANAHLITPSTRPPCSTWTTAPSRS